ncbi:MAG: hypothetical protein KGL39_42190 [Patescibacteria group bacterium]|nr:hypothetical protein [Patescibacteria group bacterium]
MSTLKNMPEQCTFTISFLGLKFTSEDADGSKCDGCGDQIFINQTRIVARMKIGKKIKEVKTDIVLCQSCKDLLKECHA